MRLKFSEFLALGAFAGWFINYMKFKKTWAKWLFGLVCLGSIGYIVLFNETGTSGVNQTASTSGSNSPATIQSATTTGSNSPVIQAAAGATVNAIINNGVSVEQMRALLKERFDTPDQVSELAKQFPRGYALIGIASGHLVWEPRLKSVEFSADWEKTKILDSTQFGIILYLSKMEVKYGSALI